jgi:hypothetical protein
MEAVGLMQRTDRAVQGDDKLKSVVLKLRSLANSQAQLVSELSTLRSQLIGGSGKSVGRSYRGGGPFALPLGALGDLARGRIVDLDVPQTD